ncbi:DsbA family oxidoreductase [Dechloromonas sp. HYN0024]|uniref:DsbA family oxidoreductase n=1 Tax=Dechloromonas sp. HYN0024 TaxID=2231055 RepID=UPI000E441E53|nr:DsbA family oxidoreductase [Dechloromonas sp. HYN0024]AXS80481.1 DsbA family oxidoreductase [Dechloromonas sp. HYN0024]
MTSIDIVSDLVCPWCFIGLRRLDAAIAEVTRAIPDFACEKRWRPFFLNPDTPPEGEPYRPFLERKFGGPALVEALFERVRAAGRSWGIDYAFEKIGIRANTLQAHRLIHWAQQRGDAAPLVERLFVGQFQRGEHVGDVALLVRVAVECGYPEREVENYLASGQDTDLVRAMERQFRAMGISMVPTFIVDGRHVIVGAEDPSVLAAAILQSLAGNRT